MTKFEQVGVNMQYDAISKKDANKKFARSCECCCNKGMRIECDHCNIASVHTLVIAYFEDQEEEN